MNISTLLRGRTGRTGRTSRTGRIVAATATAVLTAAGLGISAAGTASAAETGRDTPQSLNGITYSYALQNQNTGRCVDDSFAYGLRAFTCNGMNFQKFNFYQQSNGSWVLQNQNTGRCVDDSLAYGLRAFTCNGMNFQTFNFV